MVDHNMNRCPVCGMPVHHRRFTVEYHKIYFHCCSEQCQERFNTTPKLYSSGVVDNREPILKRRTLRLEKSMDETTAATMIEYLGTLMWVREVVIEDRYLTIEYDLWLVTQSHIENKLRENNISLDDGLFQRLRRAWIRNVENNELENLAHPPAPCCNYPPRLASLYGGFCLLL
jgi:YHS domain-containing protein